ncbi:caspase domain-containing protein [Lenzites betulinus]|nr:caspase domain-containing protein [Lenzites betulinus]
MPAMSKLLSHPPGLARPEQRTPVKRALIIGINYLHAAPGSQVEKLQGAHKDARTWRQLLLDTYGYRDEDITMMLDELAVCPSTNKLPTRDNIIFEIDRLVKGLQSGDRVVFFYSGHSLQLASTSVNEDDGFDEALVPMDSGTDPESEQPSNLIIDNDLRIRLVDPLPEGAYLTAVFDSCHSGTMLDLDHYACNAVYYPWLNRGLRRSRSIWQGVARKDAQDANNFKRDVKVTKLSPKEAVKSIPGSAGTPRGRPDLRMYSRERLSKDKVVKFDASIVELPPRDNEEKRFQIARASTLQIERTPTFPGLSLKLPRCYSFDQKYRKLKHLACRVWPFKTPSESPERLSRQCDGSCLPQPQPKVHVLSISACKDPQQTYESTKGDSMTKNLVALLQKDPYPPCRQLVQLLGHSLHKTAMQVHRASRKQIAKKKRGYNTRVLDGVNFQDPQVRCSDWSILLPSAAHRRLGVLTFASYSLCRLEVNIP